MCLQDCPETGLFLEIWRHCLRCIAKIRGLDSSHFVIYVTTSFFTAFAKNWIFSTSCFFIWWNAWIFNISYHILFYQSLFNMHCVFSTLFFQHDSKIQTFSLCFYFLNDYTYFKLPLFMRALAKFIFIFIFFFQMKESAPYIACMYLFHLSKVFVYFKHFNVFNVIQGYWNVPIYKNVLSFKKFFFLQKSY